MPGYIIHLTEAKLIYDQLKSKGFGPDADWYNAFCLGTLLPDTKKKQEKISSHFWNEEDLGNVAIAPDLNRFMSRYGDRLTGHLMLGYWVHLHLDWMYVNEFWPQIFCFQNDKGEVKKTWNDVTQVHVLKKNTLIPVRDFFSGNYYYGDYSKSNHYLWNKYQATIPTYKKDDPILINCPIREVYPDHLALLLEELKMILAQSETDAEGRKKVLTTEGKNSLEIPETKVFDMADLERFIQHAAVVMTDEIEKSDRRLVIWN